MIALCEAATCRRQALLAYFGEDSPAGCGHCDLCRGGVPLADATVDAQKALSAVARTGGRFGAGYITDILIGRETDVIRRNVRETGLNVTVAAVGVEKFMAGEPVAFDVCWLDPPYAVPNHTVENVVARLAEQWLASGAIVVVERAGRGEPFAWPERLGEHWERRYGETTLFFATEGDR